MKTLRTTIISGLLTVIACSNVVTRVECPIGSERWSALQTILAGNWRSITPDNVAELWPTPIAWGSEASGKQPCSGSVTFSYLEHVQANDCLCCDTFAFTDVPSRDGCTRRLSSVTLVRDFAARADARVLAKRLVTAVGGAGHEFDEPVTTILTDIAPATTQTANVQILSREDKWRVRLLIYRISSDSTD